MQKVLVVEDDGALLNIYKKMIGTEYQVSGVVDGKEALRWMEEELPGLVFLDLEMPEMDGLTVLKKMKEKGWLEKVKVVILSNYSKQGVIDKAMRLGAVDYIKKEEIELEEVMEACRKYLGKEKKIDKVG